MRALTLLAVLALASPLLADAPPARVADAKPLAAEPADLSGFYWFGTAAEDPTPEGVATIQRAGDSYLVQWVTAGGVVQGVGVRTGDTLSVGWLTQEQGKVIRGISVYRIVGAATGPRLVGRWTTIPGDGTIRLETLTWLRSLPAREPVEGASK